MSDGWTSYNHHLKGYLRYEHLSAGRSNVPCLIVSPDTPRPKAAIIVVHGGGGNKETMLTECTQFAVRGFLALAPDAVAHGERRDPLVSIGARVTEEGVFVDTDPPLWFLDAASETADDVSDLVDYLCARPDVRAKSIGMTGESFGGLTTFLSAAREKRIAAAVPVVSSLHMDRWAVEHNKTPVPDGMKDFFSRNGASVLAGMYPPRPLLIVAGQADPILPARYVKETYEVLKGAYDRAGCPERIQLRTYPLGHDLFSLTTVTQELADWFQQRLAP